MRELKVMPGSGPCGCKSGSHDEKNAPSRSGPAIQGDQGQPCCEGAPASVAPPGPGKDGLGANPGFTPLDGLTGCGCAPGKAGADSPGGLNAKPSLAPLDAPGGLNAKPGFAPLDAPGGCGCAGVESVSQAKPPLSAPVLGLSLAAALITWATLYSLLPSIADALAFSLLGLEPGSHTGEAVRFFLYDTPKVLMLLVLVVFGVGVLRSFFTPERTRRILAGRREATGNVLAALLGVVTPFCSCSAVPLFVGFVTAGVPLGVTFSFLVSAPMVNEIALVMLYGLLGWKVAALYAATGLAVAVLSGFVIGRLGMEGHVEDWVRLVRDGGGSTAPEHAGFAGRVRYGLDAVKDILGKVWLYVILGIAVGAGIHGYVPDGVLAGIMGRDAWWSVPAAVVIGVPMYSNAAGIIPVAEALLGKGAALGTVLAFMMAVIALSLPEMVILRKVLKPRLIGTFIAVVSLGILLVGWLFNMVV